MMLDPAKYAQYHLAIVSAIDELTKASSKTLAIAVVGAGFGGLVQSVLEAMQETGAQCDVVALDKNPVAVAELRRRKSTESDWKLVQVWEVDIRDHEFVETFEGQVDILVSELLGGFSDNELAPECLAACNRLLTRTGVVIPRSTTSYLAPVHAPTLRHVMLNSKDPNDFERWWVHAQHVSAEATDVVLLAHPLAVFTFEYPHVEKGTLYRRRCLPFTNMCSTEEHKQAVKRESWCHGFMGYFEADLHGGIMLSTVPGRATPQLMVWNPVFFPVKVQFCLPAQLNVCRASSQKGERVWYSWTLAIDEESDDIEHNRRGLHCYMATGRRDGFQVSLDTTDRPISLVVHFLI